MKIESVAAQPDRAGRYRVTFSDGSILRLYRQTIQDFCLYSGAELTEEQYINLQKAASQMSAKMRAVRIVSAGNVSKQDLCQRLIQKGEKASDAQQAVAWMAEMNLLDDRRTAEQIVENCIRKGYGIARAKQALYEKRIPKEYWQEVLEDYPEQEEAIRAFIDSHLPVNPDQKAIKKVIDALLRKGHSYGIIRRILNEANVMED